MENTDAQHIVHFEEAQDFSDAGSLITQAPQSQSIHTTINALSTWVSAIQPRESWYLAGWIGDSPIDFLVDPGAVVSAISLQSYEKLMESNAIITPMKAMHLELEAANKSDMRVHGMCNLELSVHGLIINIDAVVVDLNCHAILGMDILGDASKLPFILDLVKGTLSGGGYETIQLHRFQAATECFAETSDSVCIPPHSEVMLWAKLKTNNGRKGPTAGVVLALQTFVQEFGLLVGRSLVRADADDWKIPILIYNSDPCTMKPANCTCNPVIIPAHTRIARVEEIQAIQHIGSRETEMNAEEGALPPYLIDVLDAATELTSNQRARAAALLAKHVNTFPAPGTPITGRTEAVMHDIDTGSTRPIRCNPRKLSPKKIKIQQELVDKMLEEGQIEHSVSAWSAPTVLVTKKDGTTRFCVDYRRLNNSTKKDAFPLPRIDDSLNSLSGQSWFSMLDLASGYWQVRLSEDAKPKTAFATHSGLFQFAVMPFGLCSAPATFERLMSQVMRIGSAALSTSTTFWSTTSRAQLVVPRSLRDTIFNDSHHTTYGGHFGITHTHSKLQLHYFWPGMSDFVKDRISACHKCVARKSPINRHHPMGHVPVSGRFERVAMDLLDVSVISAKGYKYILVVCDYFTKYTEAYPLKDKTARSVADALMDIWLPRYGFPLFLHSDQGKEFDNVMIHKLSELLGTVKTKTTPYHPRSDGLVERFNRTLLAMLAMFVSQEHDNWDDLLPFMMLAYNTTVHTSTGYTPYRLVFGDECNLPGNLVHRELRADPPPGDPGTYATWVQQALYESYDEVCAQQQRATHRQKRNYDSKAVARAFPIGCWTLRYYPPARKNKLCSPWIGPYKIVRAPMEWVVGIQIDADARIVYVHMDDLKRCAPPNPEPTWPDTARGTSIVVSTRAPSTLALSDVTSGRNIPDNTSHQPRSSAHHPQSVTSGQTDVRAPTLPVLRDSAHHTKSSISGQIDVRAPSNEENIVKTDTVQDSIVKTYAVPSSTWNLQDENCILSMKSNCSIDVKGYRFFTMERLFYALQLLSLGDRKFIGQLARYSRMDYVKKCVNTRFELASSLLQDKWLDEQFQTWTQIITARILSDPTFKQALLDSAGSPLFDPEEPVYATALTSARKMCVQRKLLCWPTWITLPTRVTRGQVLV